MPLILLFFSLVLQMAFLKYFSVFGVTMNLVMIIFVLFLFVSKHYQNILLYAFLLGLIMDFYSGAPFGAFTFSLLTALFILDLLMRTIQNVNTFHFILFISLGTIIYNTCFFTFLFIMDRDFILPFRGMMVEIVYNISVVLFVWVVYNVINLFIKRKRRNELFY